ncbi:MAG: gamma-glutamylcyclotransferase family protein, partial [Candidatus Methylumidiphilus sp.]
FVYGTLKPGEPTYARFLAGRTLSEESASVVSVALYSAGPYPYLVAEPDLATPDEHSLKSKLGLENCGQSVVDV